MVSSFPTGRNNLMDMHITRAELVIRVLLFDESTGTN